MARHAPNARLAALLAESGWSAGELARAVNVLGAPQDLALRYDRTSVAHWLTGSRPPAPVPGLVAAAFTRRMGRRVIAEDTGLAHVPQPHGLIPVQPSGADSVHRLTVLLHTDTDPRRRAFLANSAYTAAALHLPAWDLVTDLRPDEPVWAVGRATEADAVTLQAMTETFASLAERHGGAHIRSALAAYLSDGASHLLAAPAPRELHRTLLAGTAKLTHLLAGMTADSGRHGLAEHYYRASLGLAHEAGDRRLYAITLRAMSVQALRLGRPAHALHLAQAAVDTAGPRTDSVTGAFLLVQRAYAHAVSDQPRVALTDLNAAERLHQQASGAPGPFTGYPRAGLDYQRARILHVLGEPSQALIALQAAIHHRAPAHRRAYALTQARLAETLLAMGRVEAASVHWHIFLDHYPHLRSFQADKALTRLHQNLSRFHRQPHAITVRERAHTLARPSAGV